MIVYDRHSIQLHQSDSLTALKTLPSDSIDYCLYSPPYFNLCDYKVEGQLGLEGTIAEYLANQLQIAGEVHRCLKEGAIVSIVIGDTQNNYSPVRGKGDRRIAGQWHHRRPLQEGYREKESLHIPSKLREALALDWHTLPDLIWDKGSGGTITMLGTASYEPILMLMKQAKGRRLKALHLEPFNSLVIKAMPTSDRVHPCPYPITLVSHLIHHCCPPGETVLDPFVGSGTTAIASQSLGRRCIGIDLDCTRAIERIEESTQQMRLAL